MHFQAIANTDIGTKKQVNQDSLLVKHALYGDKEVLLAMICDGMGGLSEGELASATVVKHVARWFDEDLPSLLDNFDSESVSNSLVGLLHAINNKIMDYTASENDSKAVGTTCSCIVFYNDLYVIVHVGDSRIYEIAPKIRQLTHDHSFVQREIDRGNMTPEEAEKDKRRSLLLQCVGASINMEPQVVYGKVNPGLYFICSDGFRHVISEDEICEVFSFDRLTDKNSMREASEQLITTVKNRDERDNISVILVKAF